MTKAGKIIDQVTGNPAFDGLGGYYIFLRRVLIPILLAECASPRTLWPTHGLITDFQSFLQEWQLA